jgi:hypothetical protein
MGHVVRFTHAVLISAGAEDGWPETEMVQAIAHDVCGRQAIVAMNWESSQIT